MNETSREREGLIEAATSAHRDRAPSGHILPSPAWCDLPADARDELFERELESRRLERILSPEALSVTGREVLARIAGMEQA